MNYFLILDLQGFQKRLMVDKEAFIDARIHGVYYYLSKSLLRALGEEITITNDNLYVEKVLFEPVESYDSYTHIFKPVFKQVITNKKE